jgi:hypothetical protein
MRTEKALTTIFIIGLVFKLFNWPFADWILAISLFAIIIIYFPGSFYFFSDKIIKRQNIALSIVSGLFLSLIPLGIIFKIMYLPGGEFFLLIGTVIAPIFFAITYFLKSKTNEDLKNYYKNMLFRTGVLTVLAVLFYLIPG